MAATVASGLPAGEVCFLFTDVEGSTEILRRVGDLAWADMLSRVQAVIRTAVQDAGGMLVSTEGDGAFAAFSDPAAAARACARAQRDIAASDWGGAEVRVRMGLHLGSGISPRDGNYIALAVHQAARVASAAAGGEVLATDAVAARCPEGTFTDLGLFSVRDFTGPVRVLALSVPGRSPLPPRLPPAFDPQVPRYETALVGREAEIAAVADALDTRPIVTLTGPPGVGKTRLAVAVLSHLSASLAAGPWFVDLSAVRAPAELGDAIALAVGCPPDVHIDAHLDAALDGRRGVMVLDASEHLADAVRSAVGLLRDWNPTLHVLVTGEAPLGLAGEHEVALSPLPLPDGDGPADVLDSAAGRLFVERVERVRSGLQVVPPAAAAIATICRSVDGLPLALELAAGWCAQRRPEDLAAEVAGRRMTLDEIVGRSVAALDDTRAAALAALSVAPAPVPAVLAEAALLALGCAQPAAELEHLLDTALVRRDGAGSYVVPAPVRDLAEQTLSAQRRRDVCRALLAECLLQTADEPMPLSRHDVAAAAAARLMDNAELPVQDRQRLAAQLAPWWAGRFGRRRAREQLQAALALGRAGSATAALHLALADTYRPGEETVETERHLHEAGRLLGEHDAVPAALIDRLRRTVARRTAGDTMPSSGGAG